MNSEGGRLGVELADPKLGKCREMGSSRLAFLVTGRVPGVAPLLLPCRHDSGNLQEPYLQKRFVHCVKAGLACKS